jgi:D-tagatose-1,6-bisphosphate aldolase subunit GatZ/KbaZ
MVEPLAILKVGPWLTFVMREAIFALSALEQEWLAENRASRAPVSPGTRDAMLKDPVTGGTTTRAMTPPFAARKYSYSDQSRYYWPDAEVQRELDTLIRNLREFRPP